MAQTSEWETKAEVMYDECVADECFPDGLIMRIAKLLEEIDALKAASQPPTNDFQP